MHNQLNVRLIAQYAHLPGPQRFWVPTFSFIFFVFCSPEYPIESDYDWTKWLETLLIKGLPKVEVSKVRWENAETRRRIRFGWNQFDVNKVQKVRT